MRRAGKSTRTMAEKRRSQGIFTGIFAIVLVIIIVGFIVPNANGLGIGGLGILGFLFLARYIIPGVMEIFLDNKVKEVKRADRGAVAEEKIGEILGELDQDDYQIISDIENPNGNIDHVVIAKNWGIFLIETKSHHGNVQISNGELLINGYPPEKDFIAQMLRNVYWLRDELEQIIGSKPWITPIIVFSNAFVPYIKPIKGIHIINRRYLIKTLSRQQTRTPITSRIWDEREAVIEKLS